MIAIAARQMRLTPGLAALTLLGTLTIGGCAEGWKASDQEARQWLPKAAADLKRVIVLLRTCQPRRASGYNIVWADNGNGGDEAIHCGFGGDGGLIEMRAVLRRARILGVSYLATGSDQKPVSDVEFILAREGLVTGGSMTSVEYHSDPQPCAGAVVEHGNSRIERRPLTSAPCRWFWRFRER
ncbi:MAG: hypothetical protein ABI240_05910 [Sphingomonas sp.]